MTGSAPLLSVVVPVFNGAETIQRLVDEIKRELSDIHLEMVLVNDGSRDHSRSIGEALARAHPEVLFVNLRRNFGEHNAVMCGLAHCSGAYAAIVDDDLQNPPSEIRALLTRAVEGRHDVVYSSYAEKKHSFFRNLGSAFNGWAASYLIEKPRGLYLSSFKVINRQVIDEILKYRGPFPYIDGLIFRVTSNYSSVPVAHRERDTGRSQYSFRRLVRLYLNMFLNFSVLPLRIFTIFGFGVLFAALLFAVAVIIEKFTGGALPSGYTSLLIIVMMLCGVQIIFMGLIGEYLGKLYLDRNGKPQWVLESITRHREESDAR